jgi:hypothetical protein
MAIFATLPAYLDAGIGSWAESAFLPIFCSPAVPTAFASSLYARNWQSLAESTRPCPFSSTLLFRFTGSIAHLLDTPTNPD